MKPKIMGIVNVTPDSFYASSRAQGEKAVKAALLMCDQGADIIDIGGQSTRPGSARISSGEELRRVATVIDRLAARAQCKLSIDTYYCGVARYAAACGVQIINDITGMRSRAMRELVRDSKLECVIMHMKGSAASMRNSPRYNDVVAEVKGFLKSRIGMCENEGIAGGRIIIDPGIGFGKTAAHNIEIIRNIGTLRSLGKRVLIGASRKSFIGAIGGREGKPLPAEERLEGSLALACYCAIFGADLLRVHDVKETAAALRVIDALT